MAGVAAAPVVVVSVFRAVPREWPTTVVQLVSFTPWLVLPASVAAAVRRAGTPALDGGGRRGARGRTALLAGPAGLRPGRAGCRGRTVRRTRWTPPDDEHQRQTRQADAAEIVRLVRENGITLLTIQEYTQALEDRLGAAGLSRAAPEQDQCAPRAAPPGTPSTRSTSWSAPGQCPTPISRCRMIRLTAESQGKAGRRRADQRPHACRPWAWACRSGAATSLRSAGWRPARETWCWPVTSTPATTMPNSGNSCRAGAGRLVDVGLAQGSRLIPTWPMDGPVPPRHHARPHRDQPVGAQRRTMRCTRVPGTDHAAIMATLTVPGRDGSGALTLADQLVVGRLRHRTDHDLVEVDMVRCGDGVPDDVGDVRRGEGLLDAGVDLRGGVRLPPRRFSANSSVWTSRGPPRSRGGCARPLPGAGRR